jgi:hypothetical protein
MASNDNPPGYTPPVILDTSTIDVPSSTGSSSVLLPMETVPGYFCEVSRYETQRRRVIANEVRSPQSASRKTRPTISLLIFLASANTQTRCPTTNTSPPLVYCKSATARMRESVSTVLRHQVREMASE